MIRRIRTRIQRFWDIMTDKEWKQAILDSAKGDTHPFEFTTMIDKSEIKELLTKRIQEHTNGMHLFLRQSGKRTTQEEIDIYFGEPYIKKSEDYWLAEQLNIDLEDDDQ